MNELRRTFKENKNFIGVVLALLAVAVVFYVVSQRNARPVTNKVVNTPTTTQPTPPQRQRPAIEVLPGRVLGHQGKDSFSFNYPASWVARVSANDGTTALITLSPKNKGSAGTGTIIAFKQQRQDFLNLKDIRNSYLGGVGVAKDYYRNVTQSKLSLDGKPGYHISADARGLNIHRDVYFTVRRHKSYSFLVTASDKKAVTSLGADLKKMALSLRFTTS